VKFDKKHIFLKSFTLFLFNFKSSQNSSDTVEKPTAPIHLTWTSYSNYKGWFFSANWSVKWLLFAWVYVLGWSRLLSEFGNLRQDAKL